MGLRLSIPVSRMACSQPARSNQQDLLEGERDICAAASNVIAVNMLGLRNPAVEQMRDVRFVPKADICSAAKCNIK